jgi:hypothetical protein
MKTLILLQIAVIGGIIALTGCKKSGIDTWPIEKSFRTADLPTRIAADEIGTEIKANNYSEAMFKLTRLGSDAVLNNEQKKAVSDTLERVKEQVKTAATRPANVKEKMDEVQNPLGKQSCLADWRSGFLAS